MAIITKARSGLAEAEALVAMFASVDSFRQGCIIPSHCDLENFLRDRYSRLRVDDDPGLRRNEVVREDESVERFLRRHAGRLLESQGHRATLRPDHSHPGAEILRWRWISLSMPPELLLAATTFPGLSMRVRILDPTLRILEPTAHLHFHSTAGISFGQIWNHLRGSEVFNKIETVPEGFSSREEWKAWLCRALIAKRILQIWMRHGLRRVKWEIQRKPELGRALNDLRRGKLSKTSQLTESVLWGFLSYLDVHSYLGTKNRELGTDPMEDYSRLDIEFDRSCLDFMEKFCDYEKEKKEKEKKEVFRKLWTQMTRIRVMLYRHLVHDPAYKGLDEFDRRFRRLDEYTNFRNSIRNEVRSAINLDPDLPLETLELRKSPQEVSKLREMHRESQSIRSNSTKKSHPDRRPRTGSQIGPSQLTWTLHFIRSRETILKDQIRSHYITAESLSLAFFGYPELLQSIRGLDIAGRELSGPLWALATPLEKVREVSVDCCSYRRDIHPLKLTVHVGEDFRHLLSGLRTIHEPFWWKLMRRGDRIGHAAALGYHSHEWCEQYPEVSQPRIERMFDIAWMLDFVSDRKLNDIPGVAIEIAHRELADHLQKWGNHYEVREFITITRKLGRPGLWQEIGCPHWHHFRFHGKYWKLLGEILQRYDKRSEDVVQVTNAHYGKLLGILQDELAKLLSRWQTPIEVNPSSNLLIGRLSHPLAQPLFHLDQHDRQEKRGLNLTLSADDPVTFSTCLADEFAYAWSGMVVGSGESPAFAQEWLERAARAARRAAF